MIFESIDHSARGFFFLISMEHGHNYRASPTYVQQSPEASSEESKWTNDTETQIYTKSVHTVE